MSLPREPRPGRRPRAGVVGSTLLALTLIASACAVGGSGAQPEAIEEYPDAIRRDLDRQIRQERDVAGSAMPPRHLDAERFPETLVDRLGIVSGGPAPDGIPSIDEPNFSSVDDVDWLADDEAVILLDLDDQTRVYPVQILIWHEIVNDVVGETPVTITFCPLCNSAVAFDRRVQDEVLDFGTSGSLYNSALVMYDRQTESLWTHFDGLSVVGTLMGTELRRIPVQTVAWETVREAHPDALVLNRDTENPRNYGRNAYPNYDLRDGPLPGFFQDTTNDVLPAMNRIVGVREPAASEPITIPLELLQSERALGVDASGTPLVAFWAPGAASALEAETVDGGRDIGQTGVFDPVVGDRELTFSPAGDDGFVDDQTGSTWTVLGAATDGPLAGTKLEPVEHLDTFWFAWSSYVPNSRIIQG